MVDVSTKAILREHQILFHFTKISMFDVCIEWQTLIGVNTLT